jgi:hypothetical protein
MSIFSKYQPYQGYVYSTNEQIEDDNIKLWHEFYRVKEVEKAEKESREPVAEFEVDHTPYAHMTESEFHKAVENYENKQSQ